MTVKFYFLNYFQGLAVFIAEFHENFEYDLRKIISEQPVVLFFVAAEPNVDVLEFSVDV